MEILSWHNYALVNTGDLTNRGVKFPTSGAKPAVKSPLCPHPHSRGFDNTSRMTKRTFHACDQ